MRRKSALYGILGLVFLGFCIITYVTAPGLRFFTILNLALAIFSLAVWLTSSRSALSTMVGQRSTRHGANAVVYSIIFILILVAVNYISSLHHARFDLTSNKVYSLSSQSVQVVKNLKKPIKLYGFFAAGQNAAAQQLYQEYAYASPMVTYEMVDPEKHPELAEKYKVSVMGTTHLQYGADTAGNGTNVTESIENSITNAILRVSQSTKKLVYLLDGHGEANPDDSSTPTGLGAFKTALQGEGFQTQKLFLATVAAVPADCNILVIAGPLTPLSQHEIEAINAYLDKGGRALVMFRAPRPDDAVDEKVLAKLAEQWGVKPANDVVVDQVVRLFAGPALGLNPMVEKYGDHPITNNFGERTIFPMTRSVAPMPKPGLLVTPLAITSDSSWGETDIDGIFKRQEAKLDPTDLKGPLDVADAVEASLSKLNVGKGEARLVVFGSTDFADNQWLQQQFFNRDLLVNSADWLTGEENQISIRPRAIRSSRAALTIYQFSLVYFLSVLLLPELLLLAGIVVWWKRRN